MRLVLAYAFGLLRLLNFKSERASRVDVADIIERGERDKVS